MSIPLWNNKSYRLKSGDQKIAKNLELKFPEKMKFITEKSIIHYWGVIILRLFYLLLGVISKEEKGYQNLSMEVIIYRKKITGVFFTKKINTEEYQITGIMTEVIVKGIWKFYVTLAQYLLCKKRPPCNSHLEKMISNTEMYSKPIKYIRLWTYYWDII